MRGKIYEFTGEMSLEFCIACGTPFTVERDYLNNLRETHKNFYCPNGHPQSYRQQSELERLREDLKKSRDYHQTKNQGILDLENQNRALRGTITRLKKKK